MRVELPKGARVIAAGAFKMRSSPLRVENTSISLQAGAAPANWRPGLEALATRYTSGNVGLESTGTVMLTSVTRGGKVRVCTTL